MKQIWSLLQLIAIVVFIVLCILFAVWYTVTCIPASFNQTIMEIPAICVQR